MPPDGSTGAETEARLGRKLVAGRLDLAFAARQGRLLLPRERRDPPHGRPQSLPPEQHHQDKDQAKVSGLGEARGLCHGIQGQRSPFRKQRRSRFDDLGACPLPPVASDFCPPCQINLGH